MGHYLSEMEGESFTKTKEIDRKIGHKILEDKKLDYSSITSCDIEWITSDPSRKWINVYYECLRWGSCVTGASYEKYKNDIEE